jgi:hypothetical protein
LLGEESVHGFLDEEFAIGVGLDGVEQESVLDKEAAEVVAVFVGGALLGVLSVKVIGDGFEEIAIWSLSFFRRRNRGQEAMLI